jgi:hypothetical protein
VNNDLWEHVNNADQQLDIFKVINEEGKGHWYFINQDMQSLNFF